MLYTSYTSMHAYAKLVNTKSRNSDSSLQAFLKIIFDVYGSYPQLGLVDVRVGRRHWGHFLAFPRHFQ